MRIVTKWMQIFFISLFGMMFLGHPVLQAAGQVTLYTPYTKISVPPGQTITYVVDVINHSSTTKSINLSVAGIPKGWHTTLQAADWNIRQITLLPQGRRSITLKVEVPLKVNKGLYRFRLVGSGSVLPLSVVVSKKGTYKTEFTTEQANMQGQANATFTFRAKLTNRTAGEQLYALKADAPPGWFVTFRANYKNVTSVNIKPNNSAMITIEVKPSVMAKAGSYKIPVEAVTQSTSARLMLEAVITGTYDMELTTPTGRLSTDIVAGNSKKLDLLIKNTGSSTLQNIRLRASTPSGWEVTFKPKKIERLAAGAETRVTATLKAFDKSIPGDYITTLTASTPETRAKAVFRVTVKTSLLWGWVGILIILLAIGGVYYLFKKYGRR